MESFCVEIKYNYKLPTTLIFLSLRCTTWLKQKAPLGRPSSTAAAGQWKTSLTLSSLASISTTSVSTSSISALENKKQREVPSFSLTVVISHALRKIQTNKKSMACGEILQTDTESRLMQWQVSRNGAWQQPVNSPATRPKHSAVVGNVYPLATHQCHTRHKPKHTRTCGSHKPWMQHFTQTHTHTHSFIFLKCAASLLFGRMNRVKSFLVSYKHRFYMTINWLNFELEPCAAAPW